MKTDNQLTAEYITANTAPNSIINGSAYVQSRGYTIGGASAGTIGSSIMDEYNRMNQYKELELVDGSRVMLRFSASQIYKIQEKRAKIRKFSWKFPFYRYEDGKRYSVLELGNGDQITSYNINCSVGTLMKILGLDYNSWDGVMMENLIKRGEEN